MSLKSKIEKIITAIENSNISEIEISNFWGAQKIKLKTNKYSDTDIKKSSNTTIDNSTENIAKDNNLNNNNIEEIIVDSDNIVNEEMVNSEKNNKDYTIINAPLVGTFYLAAKPGDKPFVEVGSQLNIGDPLCIIEAMKIFNTIESEFDGEIKEIFIQDGAPIEYGQPLFSIDIN